MNPSKLTEGEKYLYIAPYGKPIEIVKCLKISLKESDYKAEFEVLTDPCGANRIGVVERFNHIEIERYIELIDKFKIKQKKWKI